MNKEGVVKKDGDKIEEGQEIPSESVEQAQENTESIINSATEDALSRNVQVTNKLGAYSEAKGSDFTQGQEATDKAQKDIEELQEQTEAELAALDNPEENTENKESKEGFSEGHIMNPKMLDKIAQLEAIDPTTLEFNQERYDAYMNGQAKLGSYSVGENQKKLQKVIDKGRDIEDYYYDTEVIYGQGGWNRYPVNQDTGEVFLSRGPSNTTGSEEYKTKLAEKAKELGLQVKNSN